MWDIYVPGCKVYDIEYTKSEVVKSDWEDEKNILSNTKETIKPEIYKEGEDRIYSFNENHIECILSKIWNNIEVDIVNLDDILEEKDKIKKNNSSEIKKLILQTIRQKLFPKLILILKHIYNGIRKDSYTLTKDIYVYIVKTTPYSINGRWAVYLYRTPVFFFSGEENVYIYRVKLKSGTRFIKTESIYTNDGFAICLDICPKFRELKTSFKDLTLTFFGDTRIKDGKSMNTRFITIDYIYEGSYISDYKILGYNLPTPLIKSYIY